MSSGADNNAATLDYPENTVIATDLNTFMYQEYKAIANIAKELGKTEDEAYFAKRANQVRKNIDTYLWDEADGAYYNLDSTTGQLIKRVSYNSLHPV